MCEEATRTPPGSEGGRWTGPSPRVSTTLSTITIVSYQELTSSEGGKWMGPNPRVSTTLSTVTNVNYQEATSSEVGKWTGPNLRVTTTLLTVKTVNTNLTPLKSTSLRTLHPKNLLGDRRFV